MTKMLVSIRDLTLRLPRGDRTLTVRDGVPRGSTTDRPASVGLHDRAQNYRPQLGGGGQQRVARPPSRAIDPPLLLADEAGGIFFFFQAEDGIRDLTVTGVQTCALPI